MNNLWIGDSNYLILITRVGTLQMHMATYTYEFPNIMTVGGNVKDWASQYGKSKEKRRCRYDIFEKYYLKASWDRY